MIGINLYSIRHELSRAPEESLKKVAEAGFDAVELYLSPDLPAPESMRALCDRHGLAICGMHDIHALDHPEAALKTAEIIGSPFVTYPYPEGRDLSDPAQVQKLVEDLNRAGAFFAQNGKTLTYHNHHLEFMRTGGTPVLEQLLEKTDPRFVQFQLDIYWVQYGGCDPLDWCRKLGDRLAQLHVRDYAVGADGTPRTCIVGQGNLDIPAVLAAAGSAQWILEQEEYLKDPFEELAAGVHFLKTFP
jgi:sugar phosphate isomerase/epimerase